VCRPLWAARDRRREGPAGSPSRPPAALRSHHPARPAVALDNDHLAEAAGNPHNHLPGAEAVADTHQVEAVGADSYQRDVAVDRSWTPSSQQLSWQRACLP
jgi:hypothetical protein